MIVSIEETTVCGRAVTVPESVDGEVVARAIREGKATDGETTVRIRAHTPHTVHERVGYIHSGMGLRIKTALAVAARARGYTTHVDSEIRAYRRRLRSLSPEHVSTRSERQALAAARTETEQLRERVAETRGELTARQDGGEETASAEATVREAARALSEAETSAVAARQNLARRRRAARDARDRLEQRLSLEDDLANLQRQARSLLLDRVRRAYASAVSTAPGGPGTVSDPFAVDTVTAALAVARLAAFDAPLVLACDRFQSVRAASAWLDAPVIHVSGPAFKSD